MVPAELDRIWGPANLENLARTYWRFLSRVTLGLVRVYYGADSRSVVLLSRPITLLRFETPEYTLEPEHGLVRWRIRDGLLVARTGRGSRIPGARRAARGRTTADGPMLHIEVEVANFYPSIAVGFSMPVYRMTQSFVHVPGHPLLPALAGHAATWPNPGSEPWPSRLGEPPAAGAEPDRSAVADAERPHLGPVVAGRDPPDGARARAHDQRLGAGAAVTLIAHALEHVAVGDAGGGEEDVLAGHEVVAGQDLARS